MRILFLTQRLPYAPNRGDRVRAFHELRVLASRHEVHLVALVHDEEEAAHARDLEGRAASVHTIPVTRVRNALRGGLALATAVPLTHALLDGASAHRVLERLTRQHRPDVVLAFCSSMARFAFEPPLAGIPLVFDIVDVDSAKWAALAATAAIPKRWVFGREARLLARFEARATRAARCTFAVNERETTTLRELAGSDARIEVLANGVDTAFWKAPRASGESANVVFCGVMDYAPNEQGAWWFARDVWPLVLAQRPDARLWLVGTRPTRRLTELPRAVPSIAVTGTVPDVRPYLWDGAVAIAPLSVARGIQNKVLEAVAAGLPAVVTGAVAAGLPPEVMPACVVADAAPAFAGQLVDLLGQGAAARRKLVDAACLDALTWESRLAPLLDALDEVRTGR